MDIYLSVICACHVCDTSTLLRNRAAHAVSYCNTFKSIPASSSYHPLYLFVDSVLSFFCSNTRLAAYFNQKGVHSLTYITYLFETAKRMLFRIERNEKLHVYVYVIALALSHFNKHSKNIDWYFCKYKHKHVVSFSVHYLQSQCIGIRNGFGWLRHDFIEIHLTAGHCFLYLSQEGSKINCWTEKFNGRKQTGLETFFLKEINRIKYKKNIHITFP